MIKGAKILIVDDEQPIRTACCKILSEEGALVQAAEDGLGGLEKAKTNDFDLSLVDLKMP
jgi:CheY-like chemotaxis protein